MIYRFENQFFVYKIFRVFSGKNSDGKKIRFF